MAELSRPSVDDSDRSGGLTTGIYIATVISHLDPSFMGSIEVNLLECCEKELFLFDKLDQCQGTETDSSAGRVAALLQEKTVKLL